MKKLTVYDMFLAFAIILTVGTEKSVYSLLLLLFSGILELADVIPRMVRLLKDGGK